MSSNDSLGALALPGTKEALRHLAREHLGLDSTVFYAPDIPRDKLDNVRRVHAQSLGEGEEIVVVHDDTVFGSADEGFAITAARLCWKNIFADPRQVPWEDLDPAKLAARPGAVLFGDETIEILGDLSAGACALFQALALRARTVGRGPYRAAERIDEPPTPVSLPAEVILALARTHLGEERDFFYPPSIPASKERHARKAHAAHLPEDEPLVVLYDDTVFGSAEEGFLLTPERLCWKNIAESPKALEWARLDAATIQAGSSSVKVHGGVIQLTGRTELALPVEALLRALAEEVERRRAAR